jgi:hypothetical protein
MVKVPNPKVIRIWNHSTRFCTKFCMSQSSLRLALQKVSQNYKTILYYIGLKAPIDFSKVFINHMCHSIKESKTKGVRNAHHSRLLSYMFYSSYLLHSLKPIFPDPKFLRVFHFSPWKPNWSYSQFVEETGVSPDPLITLSLLLLQPLLLNHLHLSNNYGKPLTLVINPLTQKLNF